MTLRKVLITNHCRGIRRFKERSGPGRTAYVCLDCKPLPAAKDTLDSSGAQDLTKEFFSDARRLRAEYGSFLRGLNKENSSLQWWAMNFTAKDIFISDLYNNVFYALAITEFVKKGNFENLLVFCSYPGAAKAIRPLEGKPGIKVNISISRRFSIKGIMRALPVVIFYSAVRAVIRRLAHLTKRRVDMKRAAGERYLIVTQFEDRSFARREFNDTYFKSLKDFLSEKNIGVLTAGLVMCRFKKLLGNKQRDVFAFEGFLRVSDMLRCLFTNLRLYLFNPVPKGSLSISGIDVSGLIKSEIRHSINSGQFFSNLSVYYACLNLLKRYQPAKVLYPFEGRSWEKMVILAARRASSNIRLTGYQHASINARHTPFCLGEGEFQEMPFPDEIISSGHITRDIMHGLLNFPQEKIKPGCALRQSFPEGSAKSPAPGKIRRILVVLSTRVEEDAMALEFLDKAFKDSQEQDLILRPHPYIDFQKVLKIYRPKNIKYELDNRPLSESLNSADLLIYASSTVSLEAVFQGIPVIFMELTQDLAADPLFDLPYFKWNCKDPGQLKKIIEDISSMDKAAFLDLQKKAQEYSRSYCARPTKETMEAFV